MRLDGEGRHVDIRVSTAETIWGEKVVLRLLDQSRTVLKLDQLGLAEQAYDRFAQLVRSPYGMVVVSGPTGSGKTTTLYAAITELDPVSQNITTIEDPVEYTFENINQMQIRKMANLTFANGLKAILRQDPDVILVGEIRDLETAEIAVQSALTGHLVLTSLHATDAAGVIQRFMEMGIEGFLVSSALVGVVAQRLVRRVCPYCVEAYKPTPDELRLWKDYRQAQKTFVRGRGCGHCANTGYRGRIGVFEVLPLTDSIKRLISVKASAQAIREQAVEEGMTTLRADAVQKVAADVTTLSEVVRCVWLNA
jgi:type IV pilus assembly protein PilB